MAEIDISRLLQILSRTIGPAPWYWKTFPALTASGRRLTWTHHGDQGPLAYLVSLSSEEEPDKPLLALNTYCRAFRVPPSHLGIWCPEGGSIRFACFDPAQLKSFELAEVAGWFKRSSERIYAAVPRRLRSSKFRSHFGRRQNSISVPPELQTVDELIVPKASYPDPAFALYVFYLHAGLVEVLPQKWFTAGEYEVGYQWITRAARDPESHRIVGDCFRIGSFLLEEDGVRLDRWLKKNGS